MSKFFRTASKLAFKKSFVFILVALISAIISGLLTNRSALYGKIFDHLNYHLNDVFSQFLPPQNTFKIQVMALSRRLDNTHIKTNQTFLNSKVNLGNSDTAFVIMDPWNSFNLDEPITPNKTLQEYITQNKLIPLVEKLLKKEFPIYVATNKCGKNLKNNCGVHEDFPKSKKVEFVYHQFETTTSFENKLRKKGIKNLIYIGYDSNQCLLGSRSTSMIPMFHSKFKIYYIPEVSKPSETYETFPAKLVHEITTFTISQWIADVLNYNEVISSLDLSDKLN